MDLKIEQRCKWSFICFIISKPDLYRGEKQLTSSTSDRDKYEILSYADHRKTTSL